MCDSVVEDGLWFRAHEGAEEANASFVERNRSCDAHRSWEKDNDSHRSSTQCGSFASTETFVLRTLQAS